MKKTQRFKIFGIFSTIATLAVIFACTSNSGAKEKPKYTFKEGKGPAGAMISIDGQAYNEDELIGEDKMDFAEIYRKLYDLRMDRISGLLLKKAYGEKAKKENKSVEEYVETKVLKADPKISNGEYEAFVKEKKIPKEQINAQLKDRIMAYMKAQKKMEEKQKLIVKLSKEHKVEVYFGKPNLKVEVQLGNSPVFGAKDAKVEIVEFSDFQCPFCSQAAKTVTEIKKMYGKKVKFAFKHFPLPMHPQARPASEASMCVNEQNTEKFWKYHDLLFQNQQALEADSLKKYAKEVGVNTDQFNKCFDAKKYANAIQEDLDYGSRIGVRSTPTFFINGRLVSGALPIESFKEIIDEEMAGG
ncbi:MAG: DsbA family protein [Bacteriovoracia bacterium]